MEKSLESMVVEVMKNERIEADKASKKENIKVNINPNSYIGKEIRYQTALLRDINSELREIKQKLRKQSK